MQQPAFHIKVYPLDQDPGKTWFVEYKAPDGRRLKKYGRLSKCVSLEDKRKEVLKIIAEIESTYTHTSTPSAIEFDIVAEISKAFKDRSLYLRPKSIATYESKINYFCKWVRNNRIKYMDADIALKLIQHLKEKNLNNTTINSYRTTLKTICNDLVRKKIITDNPFNDLRKLREYRKSYRYFNEDQQFTLEHKISKEDPELWLACQFQYYLLLRPNELRTIKVGAFDLKNRHGRVIGEDAKNLSTQYFSLPDAIIDRLSFLRNYPPHFYVFGVGGRPGIKPHTKKFFPSKHQEFVKQLGMDHHEYKFYSWKHTGAVMYYLHTGDIKGLKEQGRWHSLDMVNEYLKNLGVLDIARVRKDFPAIASTNFSQMDF